MMTSFGDHEHVLRLADRAEELGDESCNVPMLRLFIGRAGAPHSFFDREYEEFAAESTDAWGRVLAFVAANS